ncbi:hypothetical protein QBC40DRAFT_289695 [Triangularia verruculosa]|uniref:Uncharacterized protein n=1 Tax=Triangularia verruculosa TaxID=2587418 RepID=A0AAN7AQS8_9PEZI|nr:hypothetical protein QBC40DRAFT_289695 [Triangularia verruculosa]
MGSKMATNSKRPKINLLTTPGEIRNQIYSYILPTHETIVIASQRKDGLSSSKEYIGKSLRRDLSTLFLISKQIYLEASGLFYSNNTFVLPGPATSLPHQAQVNLLLRWFLDRIGERNCSNLRRLGIPFPLEGGLSRLKDGAEQVIEEEEGAKERRFISGLVRRCPNLEELEVDLGKGDTPSLAGSAPEGSKMEMAGSVERLLKQSWAGLKVVRVYWGDEVIYKQRRRARNTDSLRYRSPSDQVQLEEEWVVENMRDDETKEAYYQSRYFERWEWRLEDAIHDFYSPDSSLNLRSSFALERYRAAARAAEAAPPRDWLSANHPRIEFAKAFLKSPSRAMSERNEEKEWWRVRRKMAREYIVTYCCTLGTGSSYRTRSKREKTARWMRDRFARL